MNREHYFLAGILLVLFILITHSCSNNSHSSNSNSAAEIHEGGPLPQLAQNQVPENPNVQSNLPDFGELTTHLKDPNDTFEDVDEEQSKSHNPHGKLQM